MSCIICPIQAWLKAIERLLGGITLHELSRIVLIAVGRSATTTKWFRTLLKIQTKVKIPQRLSISSRKAWKVCLMTIIRMVISLRILMSVRRRQLGRTFSPGLGWLITSTKCLPRTQSALLTKVPSEQQSNALSTSEKPESKTQKQVHKQVRKERTSKFLSWFQSCQREPKMTQTSLSKFMDSLLQRKSKCKWDPTKLLVEWPWQLVSPNKAASWTMARQRQFLSTRSSLTWWPEW